VYASNFSDLPTTVAIRPYNRAKVQASLTLTRVIKRPMNNGVTYRFVPDPDGGSGGYYEYTITAQRADSGVIPWIHATPISAQVVNTDAWLGSNSLTTEVVGTVLQQYVDQPPDSRWEIRTYDGSYHVPMGNLIGIDTVGASSGSSAFKASTVKPQLSITVDGYPMDALSRINRHAGGDVVREVTTPRLHASGAAATAAGSKAERRKVTQARSAPRASRRG